MPKHTHRPQVEELEPRTLLAGASLPVPGATLAAFATARRHRAPALTGTIHGRYTLRGVAYALTGSGTVTGLGQVSLSGSVRASGAGGRLTLANAAGALTLRLDGPTPGTAARLPSGFAFRIVRGSGAYRSLAGGGAVDLRLGPAPHLTLVLHPADEQPPPPDIASGVRGIVMEGPIMPVSRPGDPNERPVPGAVISVRPAGGGPELTRQTADAAGQFEIALPPGAYQIVPLPPDPTQMWPRGEAEDVVVGPGQVLDLTLLMDTGIR
jgi:hypothetical protein